MPIACWSRLEDKLYNNDVNDDDNDDDCRNDSKDNDDGDRIDNDNSNDNVVNFANIDDDDDENLDAHNLEHRHHMLMFLRFQLLKQHYSLLEKELLPICMNLQQSMIIHLLLH